MNIQFILASLVGFLFGLVGTLLGIAAFVLLFFYRKGIYGGNQKKDSEL